MKALNTSHLSRPTNFLCVNVNSFTVSHTLTNMSEQSQDLPERPKEGEEGDKGPSKSALKKAAKEKEKVVEHWILVD